MKIVKVQELAFVKNLEKAYVEGVYSDTPANRKLGRVGMSYAQYAQKLKGEGGQQRENIQEQEKQNNKKEQYSRTIRH